MLRMKDQAERILRELFSAFQFCEENWSHEAFRVKAFRLAYNQSCKLFSVPVHMKFEYVMCVFGIGNAIARSSVFKCEIAVVEHAACSTNRTRYHPPPTN